MEKMTQEKAVLQHLKENGSITSWDAITLFGATRLSAIIYLLRKEGYEIETTDLTIKNRYGNTTTIAKYILKGENIDMRVRKVKRPAKTGEYIELTKAFFNFNKIGDVLRVDKCAGCDGIIVYNHSQPRETGYTEDVPWCYLPHEYVVLQNYKPNK